MCNKTITKKPKRIGNTLYVPAYMTHTHKGMEYYTQPLHSSDVAEHPEIWKKFEKDFS